MRKLFSIVLLMACSIALMAQEMPNDLWTLDQEESHGCEYVANEVIVKFKHSSPVRIQRHNTTRRFVSATVTEVDMVLDSLGIFDVEDLMPLTGHMVSQKVMTVGGKRLAPDQNLSKLCNIVFDTAKVATVDEAIMMLERLPDVEYAEPNYIVRMMAASAEDTIYDHTDAKAYTKEPLYSHQWGPGAINLPWLWEQPKSKKRPVIAIIDTGVDIEHPDLKDNIWSNETEINGAGGKDDDKNGFFDDIHGYDFVNNTGVIGDRNGHGTHCAGIAAAVGNNGIGITGANPDALIMPIQVMDKSGRGNVATIIKGIDYANANGADILSMSFGGCGYSSAEEEALLKAYYNGKYLVGAAGNDNADIYDEDLMCGQRHMFPAAFNIVIGVMSTDKSGKLSSFSNYDSDGPYYADWAAEGSTIEEGQTYWNYDIAAPGSKIMSTYLNGTYREMSGTSMSTPLVAGALSRLLQCRTYSSQESAMGVIIQNRDTVKSYNNLDVKASMEFDEMNVSPVLVVTNYQIVDTINGGNGDGKPNPGETIEIYPTVRCIYGNAYGVSVQIHHGLNVDTTTLDIIQHKAELYNLSPGSSVRSKTPIVAKVAERCEDGYTIQLYADLHFDSVPGTSMAEISAYARKLVLKIENGIYMDKIIDNVMTLYPTKRYIFNQPVGIANGGTLIIKPGCKLTSADIQVFKGGKLFVEGTSDSLIVFEGLTHFRSAKNDSIEIKYAYVASLFPDLEGGLTKYNNCILRDGSMMMGNMNVTTYVNHCNFITTTPTRIYGDPRRKKSTSCNYLALKIDEMWFDGEHRYNNVINVSEIIYDSRDEIIKIYADSTNYLGTSSLNKIQEKIVNSGWAEINMSTKKDTPNSEAHGIVWKVVVNGYDAQDEFDNLPPLGVGKHKFEVYYNRAMDVSVNPMISFGVREPYTQNVVSADPSWSADSTIFTAYYTINARTMTDGLNRIFVKGGRDNEHFPTIDEKTRFNIIVQATGSLATGLYAEAGLGKVTLQWHTDEEDFEDLMGYHIYRWTDAGNDTTIINDVLLLPEDTAYVDFNVIPGTSYYYKIQQVTTSFEEYNFSNPVTATPLTAQKGDANGSMSVDVADVVTEVAYLTGNNPQPFIFEAADVNSDNTVNILDIVGTVNIITNPAVSSLGFSDNNTATYSIEDGILYVETPVVLGGVQFAFNPEAEIAALEALNGFEQMTWNSADHLNFMAYSMSGKTLGLGKHALLRIGEAIVEKIVLSNAQGQNVPAIIKNTATDLSSVEAMQMRLPNPNPFATQVNIPYVVGQTGKHEVRLVFTNVAGMTVDAYAITNTFGEYTYTWRPAGLPEGVYFVTLYVDGKKMQSSKLVKVK